MLLNSCINWENSTLAVASLALACVILRAELRHHQQSFTSLARLISFNCIYTKYVKDGYLSL